MPHGHIRGLSQFYVDGLERMEIAIDRRNAAPLPYQDNLRIPITLQVGTEQYEAGLRATPNMPVVWISPDLRDNHGNKVSLARVLTNNGFTRNQRIHLEVNGHVVTLFPF
jgi:hypothetical protein